MTFVSSDIDRDGLTLTFVTQFDADVERVWQVWEDPRLLERWWGPPTHPATFEQHDFEAGGTSRYYMTAPEDQKFHGYWTITAIDAPRTLEFEDGFVGDDGAPNPELPVTRTSVRLDAHDGGTRMTMLARFASLDDLEQVIAMGMEEGMKQASSQIDALLASAAVSE